MKRIMCKLRSRNGASMILAMVFMLFCLFVGGSVLAAAAGNGYRVEHLSDQQQYLNERSAALLICDQLNPAGSKQLRLKIYEIETTYQPVSITDGGVVTNVGQPTVKKTVSIQAPANASWNAMQRLVLESAVWTYMKENGMTTTDASIITLENFPYPIDQFWVSCDLASSDPVSGKIDIDGACGEDNSRIIADFEAVFACGTDAELYDFSVDFGSLTQMNVIMDGYYGAKSPVTNSEITTYEGSNMRITTVSRQVGISWEKPVIEKGDA